MDLSEFRITYPQASFIDDEDVEGELKEYNKDVDYRGYAKLDIESMVSFYEHLYAGGK